MTKNLSYTAKSELGLLTLALSAPALPVVDYYYGKQEFGWAISIILIAIIGNYLNINT